MGPSQQVLSPLVELKITDRSRVTKLPYCSFTSTKKRKLCEAGSSTTGSQITEDVISLDYESNMYSMMTSDIAYDDNTSFTLNEFLAQYDDDDDDEVLAVAPTISESETNQWTAAEYESFLNELMADI